MEPSNNMDLLPPEFSHAFPTLDDVHVAINLFAASQGYAIVKKRTRKSKKGVLRKAVFQCDKSGSYKPQGPANRPTSSRMCKCPFQALTTLEDDGWRFRVKNSSHNHVATPPESHPVLRKLGLNNVVKAVVETQTRTETTPHQTTANIRLQDDENNPMIKTMNIYNRRKMIEMQAKDDQRAEDVPFDWTKILSRGKKRTHEDAIPLASDHSEDEITTPLPQSPRAEDIRSQSSPANSSKVTSAIRARMDVSAEVTSAILARMDASAANQRAILELLNAVKSALERRSNDNHHQELKNRVARLEEEMAFASEEARRDRDLLYIILKAVQGGKQQ